jgi:hypothetical protein
MNELPPLAPPPENPTGVTKPASKGMSGCVKALLIVVGLFACAMLAIGIFVWQLVSWINNTTELQPATYPPIMLSAGEKEDVQRVLEALSSAKTNGTEFDEYVTPTVFNGALEQIFEGERAKGKKDVPVAMRFALTPDAITTRFTAIVTAEKAGKTDLPADTPLYVNVEGAFDIEIEDGRLKSAEIKSVKVGSKDTPWLINWVVKQKLKESRDLAKVNADEENNPLRAVKLLKREGDRIHIVLNGKKIPE